MARRTAPDADHRAAYMAGRAGRAMPAGVAAKATRDRSLDLMHDAGREGADYDVALRTHAPHLAESAPPRRAARRASGGRGGLRRPSRPSLRRPLGGATVGASPAHSVAGVALGFVAYALALSIADYGISGPKLWFKAKFLNEPAPAKKTAGAAA